MKVVGIKKLQEFSNIHADVRSQLESWLHEAEAAEWVTPHDINSRYPSASFLADRRVVFNIKGNEYRIDTKISFKNQVVLVIRIGTHAQY